MSANDLLSLLLQLLFISLGVITAYDYLSHRDRTRLDIALMFGSLALFYLIPNFVHLTGIQAAWLNTLSPIALVSQPYLLLRLVQYFRPISHLLMLSARISMIISWIAFAVASWFTPIGALVALLAIIISFFAIDAYAMLLFVRGALTAVGVVQQRLRFAAAGSGLLALALLSLALSVLMISLRDIFGLLVLLLAIAASICYYVGFASPRWLRRAWQLAELRKFLLQISNKPIGERLDIEQSLAILCRTANLAVGGMLAAVVERDEKEERWLLRYMSSDYPEFAVSYQDEKSAMMRAWRERRPAFIRLSGHLSENDHSLLETVNADTLLIAPIATQERVRGLLLVFLKNSSLFIEDDLDLAMLLAQQSAIFWENSRLIDELHRYSEGLEKRVEERTLELQESREQYRRIVETAQEGILVVDPEDNITFANAKLAHMLGCTVEEVLSAPVSAFMDDENQMFTAIKREQNGREVIEQYESRFVRKDGQHLWTLISTTPLVDDKEGYIGALSMIVDITERKQAEDQILQLNAELEKRVIERTAELSTVNRELEAFSYSVSHDLRAPLRALDGFSRVLMENYHERLDEQGQKFLQRIRAASQRMGQLIDALLHLSHLTRTEMRFEQVNLSDLVHTIVADLKEQYPERQIQLTIKDSLFVRGDEGLLRAALMNLINNAWKFTSHTPQSSIEFGKTEHQGQEAYFIRDNGVGFDMTYADRLFSPFQRLHRADEFEGTGIGLATVERIVRRHGGRIWVEAALNQGATFYFTI